jgi:hypothetical protein
VSEIAEYFVGGCWVMFAFGWAAGALHKFFTQAMDQV